MKNIIAIIWDFDKTLVDGYMQDPIFKKYNVDGKAFWGEVNELPKYYEKQGVKVNQDTIYLNKFINEAQIGGVFEGLNNAMLREFGAEQVFYNGIPEIFEKTQKLFANDPLCKEYNIEVEHYIVSTGFAEVIKGTKIMPYVKDLWGCELIEKVIDGNAYISEIGYTIDNTTKTRALFEINKGVNVDHLKNVNAKMTDNQRRVDFRNMIYIADGPSDVPAFSVVKQRGGYTFAIYPKGNRNAFNQVNRLSQEGRIDMFAEADYTEGTTAYMWICETVRSIAERLKQEEKLKSVTLDAPKHLV